MKIIRKSNAMLLMLLFLSIKVQNGYAQAPAIQWQKSFGGTAFDGASTVKQTIDGGYIIAGSTNSNDGDVTGYHGGSDYWVIKTDPGGTIEWQKVYGGADTDVGNDIQQTLDGGYIIAGRTYDSLNGDVGPSHGDEDYWVVKTDSLGVIEWQKCYGGSLTDAANSVRQTIDGGYVVAGFTHSHNGDVIGNHSDALNTDLWVIKLDTIGNLQWQKCLGGLISERAYEINLTADNGYIIAGYCSSNNGDVTGWHGYDDFWVVKLDSSGTLQWQKALGGASNERAQSVQQTSDGGYVVAGFSTSTDGDITGWHGNEDYWVVKLDPVGAIQWKKCYGGGGMDEANSIKQTSDGGYIVSGISGSTNWDVTGNHGIRDYWIVKLDALGVLLWQKCYGGSGTDDCSAGDVGHCIELTSDGGYILSGSSNSTNGDVTGNHGNYDYWIVKLEGTIGIHETELEDDFSVYPNPTSSSINIIFKKVFSENIEIKIADVIGKIVKQKSDASENITVDVSDLENGIYFVSVKTQNNTSTKKIIIQK